MTQGRRAKVSAGLLMFRWRGGQLEVFLAHPGGPFFAKKDDGWWSIPKGEIEEGEQPLPAALREFEEETGLKPAGEMLPLGQVRQKGGKTVHAWAFQGDWDEGRAVVCNTFSMEWPPGSGQQREFAEIDRAAFFGLETARRKMRQAQTAFLDVLVTKLQS